MDDRPAVRCPCGHSFETASTTPGRELTCPACGKPFVPLKSGTARRLAAPAEVPPSPIPGYRFLKRVGSGGMGDVYLAHQESLDRQVAVKLLPPELAKDQGYVEKFLKEARSAAKVSHENIVGAVDAGQAGGRAFFVMEYVAGESLHALIRRQKALPEAQALEFARQIARGLRHAHRHGLIHRDVKPKNILITKEGQAKLCDFGLARLLKEVDGDDELFYTTPAYASPEQCRAEPNVDHRSDIYSLGVTLFEMLTGRRPFNAEKARDLMTKHVTEEPPAPRGIHPAVSEAASHLVLRMLRKRPDERFADYDQLLAAIEAALPAGARRRKTLILAGAAAVAVLGAAGLLVALLGGSKDPVAPPPPAAATRPPEVEKDLLEARQLQTRAWDNPSEYPAVRAKWKELEEKYRGKAHHSLFSTPLMEFEAKMARQADAVAASLLEAADRALEKDQPMDAIRALRKFPEALARSEAGQRVAARALEAERALDRKVRAELQSCHELVTAGKFDEARGRSHALRASISTADAQGRVEVPAAYRPLLEDLARRLDSEQAAALKRKTETPKPEPFPAPAPLPAPKPVAPANAPAADAPKPALPVSPLAPHLAVLRDAALRADGEKREAAAAGFAAVGTTSAIHAAAAHFLSRPEAEWKLGAPVVEALAEILGSPIFEAAEKATLEKHLEAFGQIASKIAACGSAAPDALQLFACAHAHEIAAKKGAIAPVTALQARLARGAASGTWGPPASVARIEMASVLARAPGPWLARAAEGGQANADFASRFLGALCAIKEVSFDAAAVADRWKKLGAGAPDAGWTRMCDQVSERLRLAMPCDSCGAQGKHSCAVCGGAGIVPCATCSGTGSVSDGGGGKVTCTACKARKAGLCAGCNGAKSLKCGGCDGKKSRAALPGGPWRWLVDLGLCGACGGTGSLFAQAAWACPSCDGNGRVLQRVPQEFARLPAWIRTREGRLIFPALRWLARHQAPDGHWRAEAWNAVCPEPGCEPPAPVAGVPGGFDLGTTSLVLVAFLGSGIGPESDLGDLGTRVSKALAWILSNQKPDGHVAAGTTVKPVYEHLLATYALSSALVSGLPSAEKDRVALRDAVQRAVKWALSNQAKGGGWGYTTTATSDTWVTSWGGLALLAARDAGIEIPKINLNYLLQWYESVTDKTDLHLGYTPQQMGKVNLPGNEAFLGHDTLSAFGGLVRLGVEGRPTNALLAAEKTIQRDLPNPDPNRRDYAYWHWGTVFLAHRELRKGAQWTAWSNAVYREIAALQETADTCALGSLPPNDRWGVSGGRVYATAMNALTLAYAAGLRPPFYTKAK